MLFFLPQINYYISSLLSSYNIPTITPVIYLILFLCGFFVIMCTFKKKKCALLVLYLIISLLLSVLFNEDTISFMFTDPITSSPIIMLMFIYYPIFLLFLTNLNLDIFIRIATKYSVFTIAVALVSFVNYVFVLGVNLPDYMTFSYMLISSIVFCTISSVDKGKKMMLFSILGFILIFIGGCRGALLTVTVFYAFVFLKFFSSGNKKKDILTKIIIVIILLFLVIFWEKILQSVFTVLESFGYQSRVFSTILGSDYGGEVQTFFNSTTRINIWIDAIRRIGFIGYGLFGDRTIVLNEYNNPSYVHNWMLEVLLSFGIVLGLIIIGIILWIIFKCYFVTKKSSDPRMIMLNYAVFSVLMIKHSISASFVTSIDFWFYLGMGYFLIHNFKHICTKGED